MKKKVIATIMASAMCVSSLAGCGGNQGTPASTTAANTAATTAANTATTAAATTEAPTEATVQQTWPDGQVIKWLIRDQQVTDDYTRYSELKTIEMIEEELHVDIQFEALNDDDVVLAKLTGGQLPDIISWKWNDFYSEKGGIPGMYADGISIDLTEMINTKMPNLQAIFEKYPNVRKDMTNDNGQYLFFMRINPMQTQQELMAKTSTGLVIRQDWLDNVGMEVPLNMAEWYDVLTAFKTMDPNGNGELDEIPFDASSGGLMLFEAAFAMDAAQYIDQDTKKVDYGARTQKYKAYLEEMNKWYSEGLIGNLYTEDGKQVKSSDPGGSDESIIADLVGSWKGLANNNTKWTPKLIEKNPAAAITPVTWPAASNGVAYSERSDAATTVASETTLVTTDCQCLDAVAAVIDWMYSERGSELMTWGVEGETFEVAADGTKSLIKDPETGVQKKVILPNGKEVDYYKMYGNQSSYMPSFGNTDVDLATRDEWYVNASAVWAEADFSLRYPKAITLSAEQAEKVSAASNAGLFDYIAEMKWKFITGQEPLSNFDTYVANLERMGVSDIVAVYQQAYDNYMAK